MANGRQAKTKRLNMVERAQQQMDLHFPGTDPRYMWHRKNNDGYSTVPRTMPIVMQAVDQASKGTPPGHVLFSLWARSPDHPLLMIENQTTFAVEAGFSGERAVDTWRKRMRKLRDLSMIMTKKGASGDFHYVLLLNPNTGVEYMYRQGLVSADLYGRFIDRMAEIGAYGEIEGIQELWAEMQAAAAKNAEIPTTNS
ncbi:hypothetical protein [Pseudovibrio ascidiaceicola]|uniref:hypothetical protein n=1 Tax=Pseudovibrio ascidiaceicola TaxID=285279 RepID=UPI000D68FD6B|nr:hypothetical protein [Pseudovibrio ascidiaceicola]